MCVEKQHPGSAADAPDYIPDTVDANLIIAHTHHFLPYQLDGITLMTGQALNFHQLAEKSDKRLFFTREIALYGINLHIRFPPSCRP